MNSPKPQQPRKPESRPQPSGDSEPETTVLHLGKFLSEAAADRPEADSPTMLIRRAAELAAAQSQQPLLGLRKSRLSPERMVGVLAYAYVKGVYRSEDIERKMRQDPNFSAGLGGEVPTPQTIRRFRRLNRQPILTTLAKFFRWRRSQAAIQPPAAGQTAPEPSTQYYVKHEAENVLDRAAWVDNMSKED